MADRIDRLAAEILEARRTITTLRARVAELEAALPTHRVVLILSTALQHHPGLNVDDRADGYDALFHIGKARGGSDG